VSLDPAVFARCRATVLGQHHVDLGSGRSSSKPVWRADDGNHMRKDTVVRLLDAGVLVITDGSRTAPEWH